MYVYYCRTYEKAVSPPSPSPLPSFADLIHRSPGSKNLWQEQMAKKQSAKAVGRGGGEREVYVARVQSDGKHYLM